MTAWGEGGEARSCDGILSRVEENDAKVTELCILPIKNFTSADVERLATAISAKGTNTHLTSISASGHVVSPACLEVLGSAVASRASENGNSTKSSTGITSLSIGDKDMGDDGIVSLCNGLSNHKGQYGEPLKHLDLSYKNGSEVAMEAIGKCFGACATLQYLNLSRNEKIGDVGMVALSNAVGTEVQPFRSLAYRNFSECNIGPEGSRSLVSSLIVDNVQDVPKNKRRAVSLDLILNSNPIGAIGCSALGPLYASAASTGWSMLSSLSLVNCGIGDDGVAALADSARRCGSSGLKRLDLSRNGITSQGAQILSNVLKRSEDGNDSDVIAWQDMHDLRLAGNPLEDKGIATLTGVLVQRGTRPAAGNSILTDLDLSSTKCGPEGAAAALRCGGLSSLRMFGNRMGCEGFGAMAPLLRGGHPSLANLDLGGNDAKEDAVAGLLRCLMVREEEGWKSKLRCLEIGGNEVGPSTEIILEDLLIIRPDLDVARDRPKGEDEKLDM